MSRIIIGALSAADNVARRQNCLDTWVPRACELGIETVFLVGAPNLVGMNSLDHRLFLAVPDGYDELPQKTRAFCQWALDSPHWDYLFKCDDDTAIAATRLAAYATDGRDYIGAEWRPGVNYGSGGAGYLLSRRAAEIVARDMVYRIGCEDLLVGDVLRRAGIPLSIEPRFVPWGSMDRRPMPDNDLITAHTVGREAFEAIHREIDAPPDLGEVDT